MAAGFEQVRRNVAMRKFLHIFGTLILIVIFAAGIGFGLIFHKGRTLDCESKAFVDRAVLAIVATRSKQQLLDLATPEMRESVKPEQMNALFDTLSRLGPLIDYKDATGEAAMSYAIGSGSIVSASYVAKAIFESGTVTFRIIPKRDGLWMIQNFHVEPAPVNQGL